MSILKSHFEQYQSHILEILFFLESSFGKGDYLKRKNEGLIPSRNYGFKKSNITGYSFHGSGCGFQFTNYEVDLEFDGDVVGFTNWSFYIFLKNRIPEITENESNDFLDEMVRRNNLKYSGKLYELKTCGLTL
jgi:hypothetical protein